MRLKIVLPHRLFLDASDIIRIVVPSAAGSLGILPRRLDCAAALVLGILEYSRSDGRDIFVAVDEGLLVKTGDEVTAVVRNAAGGADLGALKKTVESEFLARGEEQKAFRAALARFEGEFVRRFLEAQARV